MSKLIYLPPELNNIIKQFYVGDDDFISLFIRLISIDHIHQTVEESIKGLKEHNSYIIWTKKGHFSIELKDNKIMLSNHAMHSVLEYGTTAILDDKFTQISENKCETANKSFSFVEEIEKAFKIVQQYKKDIDSIFS